MSGVQSADVGLKMTESDTVHILQVTGKVVLARRLETLGDYWEQQLACRITIKVIIMGQMLLERGAREFCLK